MTAAFLVDAPNSAALRAINYRPEVELLRSRAAGMAKRLGTMTPELGQSYWQVFTRIDCDRETGVELLSQTDMFGWEPEGRVIRRDSMPRPDIHAVRKWQILIAGAGQMHEGTLFGRSILADDRLVGKYLGPHAVALRFAEEGGDENLWTYAFLNTRVGMAAIKTCAFGTSVPGLRLDLLAALPIPFADPGTVSRVVKLVRASVEHREHYARSIRKARQLLEQLPEMIEARVECARREAKCVAWAGGLPTLSAWTFASAGRALALLSSAWRARLSDAVIPNGLFYGLRCARVDCELPHGVPFVSQRDLFLVRPAPRRVRRPVIPDRYLYPPSAGLVIAGRGTLGEGEIFGNPMLMTPSMAHLGLTEDLLRVEPRDGFQALLYTFLSTLVGMRLLRSTAVGTKILNLRTDLLLKLPIPELSNAVQLALAESVADAIEARDSAQTAEAESIRIIDEEVLPQWLA